MKKILFMMSWLMVLSHADLSVVQIEEMVAKIHEKREGVKLENLESTKEPFIRLQEDKEVPIFVVPSGEEAEVRLSLHSIINGKAYINDSWKRVDDIIMGYTLKYIGKRGVVLRNANHIKKLFLHKERDNFIHLEERK